MVLGCEGWNKMLMLMYGCWLMYSMRFGYVCVLVWIIGDVMKIIECCCFVVCCLCMLLLMCGVWEVV